METALQAPDVLRWETLTKARFDRIDRERSVVLLTCSPLEVHGPHLPLGADALEGEGLAERVLRFLPEPHRSRTFLKLPFIYAATDVVPQPGSLYFQPRTTIAMLTDLARTLAAQGFKDVIVSNFHGGPRHFLAIEKACERANRRYGTRMVSLFSLMIARLTEGSAELGEVLGGLPGVSAEDFDGDTHGGLVETSQLLALHPDWVDPDYKQLPKRSVDDWVAQRGGAPAGQRGKRESFFAMLRSFKAGQQYFLDETYTGQPALASPELGERILDTLAEKAAAACVELFEGKIGPEDCHSPIWNLRFVFLNPVMIWLSNRLLGFRNPIA